MTRCTFWSRILWRIAWPPWRCTSIGPIRSWAMRKWVRSRGKRLENAARALLRLREYGVCHAYCYVDGEPYTLRIEPGHVSAGADE
jgi:hypothetical protein